MAYLVSLNGTNVVFLGDMARSGGENLMANVDLGALNCTMVQMAHHGQNGVDYEVYKALRPSVCLWPTPQWLWDNDNGGGTGTGAAPVVAGGRASNDPREVRRRQREAERLAQEAAQAPVASIEVAAAPEAEVVAAVEAPASANVDSEPAAVVETAPAAETAVDAEANTASAAEVQQAEEVKPLA